MLRLSKLTDYGTVVLAYMARTPDDTFTAADLAVKTHLPLATVSKLLKLLTRGDILRSQRGAKGGYCLLRAPRDISAVHIIDAIEGPFSITECAVHQGTCGLEPVCNVGHNWQRINLSIRSALNDVTLEQLAHPVGAPATRIRLDQVQGLSANREKD